MNLPGKIFQTQLKEIKLHHYGGELVFFMVLLQRSLFDFDCNLPRVMITPHVAFLSVALSSLPPVSSTQYCFPFHCHKVNKQWISGRAASRNNARCTVQRKSNRVKSVISLLKTSRERGEEFKGERLKRKTEQIRDRWRIGGWKVKTWGRRMNRKQLFKAK